MAKTSVFKVAKRIRKKGEDWQAAIKRARKQAAPKKKHATKKSAAVSGTKQKKTVKKYNIKNSTVSISGTALSQISGLNSQINRIEKLIPGLSVKERKPFRSMLSSLKKNKTNLKKHL